MKENKTDYTIAESYKLPSLGKIYDTTVVPEVTLKSMTTQHEMLRLSHSDYPYKNMCTILDECITEDLGISTYDMCLGDYQFLLHKLRVVTYGPDYTMTTVCPYCGCQNTIKMNLEELPVIEYNEEIEKYKTFKLPVSDKEININFQTPRMLDNVKLRLDEYKKKATNAELDMSMVFMICALINTVDGKRPDPTKLEQWVRELPMKDTNLILNYADKLNNGVGLNIKFTHNCAVCGLPFETTFKANAEFFRPVLDI